jgi:hypothetical protein
MAKENGEHMSQNTTTTTKRSPEQHKNRQLCKPQPHEPRNKQLERAGEGRRKAKQTKKRRRKTLREDPQSYKEINNKSDGVRSRYTKQRSKPLLAIAVKEERWCLWQTRRSGSKTKVVAARRPLGFGELGKT